MVRVVLDNLNTHRASLYKARRVAKRLEFHYTPKLVACCPSRSEFNWRFNNLGRGATYSIPSISDL